MTLGRQIKNSEGGQLNPNWVEWLMGWPIGWTSPEPLPELEFPSWEEDPADLGQIPRITTVKTNRVDRIKAIGNGQVPLAAAIAWRILSEELCQ
jgi:DNA (cytosine-5)-methyltransferase 1